MTHSRRDLTPESPSELNAPEARGLEGKQRDQAAEQRDDVAGDRHMKANLRDVAAAGRDEIAQEVLAHSGTATELLALYLNSQRKAAADRRYASADHHADAEDRSCAGRDRSHAAEDRQASAADREEASLDPLTGAHDRAAGFKELHRDVDRSCRAPNSFTLALVDVDGLKAINDAMGRQQATAP